MHMTVWKARICLPNTYIFVSGGQFNYANVYFTRAVSNTGIVILLGTDTTYISFRAGIARAYGLEGADWILHSVQTGSGAHLASYPEGTVCDFLGRVKRQKREADYSPPSSAKVNNGVAIPPLSHLTSWRGA
jgi:hypothetical protein